MWLFWWPDISELPLPEPSKHTLISDVTEKKAEEKRHKIVEAKWLIHNPQHMAEYVRRVMSLKEVTLLMNINTIPNDAVNYGDIYHSIVDKERWVMKKLLIKIMENKWNPSIEDLPIPTPTNLKIVSNFWGKEIWKMWERLVEEWVIKNDHDDFRKYQERWNRAAVRVIPSHTRLHTDQHTYLGQHNASFYEEENPTSNPLLLVMTLVGGISLGLSYLNDHEYAKKIFNHLFDSAIASVSDSNLSPAKVSKNVSWQNCWYHLIRQWESLSSIAENYWTTYKKLQWWNKMWEKTVIYRDTRLTVCYWEELRKSFKIDKAKNIIPIAENKSIAPSNNEINSWEGKIIYDETKMPPSCIPYYLKDWEDSDVIRENAPNAKWIFAVGGKKYRICY